MNPNRLSIDITERILEYDPVLLTSWRNPGWWDAEGWREVVPEADWHWASARWRIQAARGYHFVEVMYMRLAEAEGFRGRYEGYNFFKPPVRLRPKTSPGTRSSSRPSDQTGWPASKRPRTTTGWRTTCRPRRTYSCTARRAVHRSGPVRRAQAQRPIARKQLLGLALIQDIFESLLRSRVTFLSAPGDAEAVPPRMAATRLHTPVTRHARATAIPTHRSDPC